MSITHKYNKLPVNEYQKHCHRRLVYGRYQELEQRHQSHPPAVAAEVSHRPLRVYPADLRYRCLLSLQLHSSITTITSTPPPQPQPQPPLPPLRNSNVSVSPKQHPLSLPSTNPTPPPKNLIGNPSLSDLQSFSSPDAIDFQDQISIVSHLLLLLKPVMLVKLPAKVHIQLIETRTRRR